jgi:hypothetical protein
MEIGDVAAAWDRSGTGFVSKFAAALVVILVLGLFGLIAFRILFVNFVDNYEVAYRYDVRVGKIEVLDKKGYIYSWPVIVSINTIDTRPMQVCISGNKRVLNCKLVQFNPAGAELFLQWHGRKDYDIEATTEGSFNDILKSYAYDGSGKSYPFLTVVRELKPEEIAIPTTGAQ